MEVQNVYAKVSFDDFESWYMCIKPLLLSIDGTDIFIEENRVFKHVGSTDESIAMEDDYLYFEMPKDEMEEHFKQIFFK